MVDLRLLRQFVVLAEECHFHRAAARLNISQPPLTAALRRLEAEVGAPLLARSNRVLGLTPAGRVLLGEARLVLAAADRALAATRDAAAGRTGTVRLGYVGSAMYGRLPAAIRTFREASPGVTLILREATSAAQVRALHEGALDAAIVIPPLSDAADLALRPFDADRLALALPAAHPFAGRPDAGLGDLSREPFVLWPPAEGPGFHERAVRLCAAAGFVPRVVQEAHGMHAVLSLVAAGAGVALVPARMGCVQPEAVVLRALDAPEARFETVVAHPASRLDPAARSLVDHLLDDPSGLS